MGDHRRRAVVDIEPRDQGFELDRFLLARIDLREAAPPPGPVAAWKSTECIIVLSAEFLTRTSTVSPTRTRKHRSGDAAVEGPIAERGAFREAAFEFNRH